MLNLLFYSENAKLSQEISCDLLAHNKHFRILHIVSEETNLINLLQTSHFDFLILISDRLEISNIFQYLNKFNVENHLKSIIVITNNGDLKKVIRKDRFLSKIFSASSRPQNLSKSISEAIEEKFSFSSNLRLKIANELSYLGFKSYHKGTGFIIESIFIVYQQEAHLCDNFEKNIYPIVAERFNTNISNVKSNIIKSINSMYAECEQQKLQKYFHFSADFKPTTKMIIYTIISNIAQESQKDLLLD
jgi:DNA integrity scanning protein DisA with diadenylate cyclase activity